jgi:hypothetical protein
MATNSLLPGLLILLIVETIPAQPTPKQAIPDFMGRKVTVVEPETDADGFFPTGPASICIEGSPQRQCYTAPKDFGRAPGVSLVQVDKDTPALLFSAASGGVSGFGIHLALLRPGTGAQLEDLFLDGMSVSNLSQHAFWVDSSISDAPIFLTADFVWGPDESHYSEHRYIVSAYVRRPSTLLDDLYYYLEDRYMTVGKYDREPNVDILTSERQEILTRLRRVKAEMERKKK